MLSCVRRTGPLLASRAPPLRMQATAAATDEVRAGVGLAALARSRHPALGGRCEAVRALTRLLGPAGAGGAGGALRRDHAQQVRSRRAERARLARHAPSRRRAHRPKALHALNLHCVTTVIASYRAWLQQPGVQRIIVKGSGEKARQRVASADRAFVARTQPSLPLTLSPSSATLPGVLRRR